MGQVEQGKEFVRPRDAAAFLGIGEATLWRWTQLGKLPKGIKLSNRVTVWRRATLEAFVAKHEGGGHAG
jgi:predicted DNA-binding transcriptional regulator AlpA